jgi:hypothetical protein
MSLAIPKLLRPVDGAARGEGGRGKDPGGAHVADAWPLSAAGLRRRVFRQAPALVWLDPARYGDAAVLARQVEHELVGLGASRSP